METKVKIFITPNKLWIVTQYQFERKLLHLTHSSIFINNILRRIQHLILMNFITDQKTFTKWLVENNFLKFWYHIFLSFVKIYFVINFSKMKYFHHYILYILLYTSKRKKLLNSLLLSFKIVLESLKALHVMYTNENSEKKFYKIVFLFLKKTQKYL